MNYDEYNIYSSQLFYDIKQLDETDVSGLMEDLAIGFLYNGKPLDVIGNEYFSLRMVYEKRMSIFDHSKEEIGIEECQDTSHIVKIWDKKEITDLYGNIYCPKKLKPY